MSSGSCEPGASPSASIPFETLSAPALPEEPFTPREIRALVHSGLPEGDACERVLALLARAEGALDLEIADGLAALSIGDRVASLGFSCIGDHARETLDIGDSAAEKAVRFSRGLSTRPLLRAAVRSGEVRRRAAETVLPVAFGEAEAEWVERARTETVRALEKAVRAARAGLPEDEEWLGFRVRLSPEERATVDEALDVAGKLTPGSTRAQRLEAMAQEYIGEHPQEAGDDGAGARPGTFRSEFLAERKEKLELETDRWSHLDRVRDVAAPECRFEEMTSAAEIDAALRGLAAKRRRWDGVLGYCARIILESRLWSVAGFASFEHYASERLGMAARTVEQRAKLEQRLWATPQLRELRDAGMPYEKLRVLSRLAPAELAEWAPKARTMTVIALRRAIGDLEETQMRAVRTLRASVPERIALLLQAAFRAVRAVEGRFVEDGKCLVRVAQHFIDMWKPHVKKARTLSQKVRERDLGRCTVPGCSRRAVHAHHVQYSSRGGADDERNLTGLCAVHHLRGIHGGYVRVWGIAPDQLTWEVGGVIWKDADFGRSGVDDEAPAPSA